MFRIIFMASAVHCRSVNKCAWVKTASLPQASYMRLLNFTQENVGREREGGGGGGGLLGVDPLN